MSLPDQPPVTSRQIADHLGCSIKVIRNLISPFEQLHHTEIKRIAQGQRTTYVFTVEQAHILAAIYEEVQHSRVPDRYWLATLKVQAAIEEGRFPGVDGSGSPVPGQPSLAQQVAALTRRVESLERDRGPERW